MENNPQKIIVHHSASHRDATSVRDINAWHRERDFPQSSLGWFVGYHYVITGDGEVKQTRHDFEEGAHTVGMNYNSIGVCVVGNFDIEYPSDFQRIALGKLLAALLERHKLKITDITVHRRYRHTSCPGEHVNDRFPALCYIEHHLRGINAILQKIRINIT